MGVTAGGRSVVPRTRAGRIPEAGHTPRAYLEVGKEIAVNMSKHLIACVALIGLGAVLLVAGVTEAWLVLPLLGCMLMMGMMIWMMVGGMGHGDRK